MFLELSRSAAFSVSGTIAVSGFTHQLSHQDQRQIVAMEGKELNKELQKIVFIFCILFACIVQSKPAHY